MSLTTTNKQYFAGGYREVIADVAFDSSYPYGGESFTPGTVGMSAVHKMHIESKNGYTFEYDYTNQKIKAFAPAPALIYEEKHTAVANLITLDYPAAWIVNVCQTGQNMAWGKSRAFGDLAANTFCVVGTIEDGVRTQLYTDGATDTVLVTYATQAWVELYKQLVQEEAVTLATGANDLANKMLAYGFCESSTAKILLPVDIADTTATGEVGIKPGYATGALDINVAQNAETAVVTYLAEPTSGFLTDRFIEDEDPAKSGGDPYIEVFDFPLLMWCISGAATVTGGATQAIVDQGIAPAAGEVNINWGYRGLDATGAAPAAGFTMGAKSSVTVTAGAYLTGHPWEIPGLQLLEVKNGSDLSSLSSVKVEMIGR